MGKPNTVSGATGQCEDTTSSVPGTNDSCATTAQCGSGLVCLGEFAWMSGGWCIPAWFAKTFFVGEALSIPDDGSVVSSQVVVCGLASVPIDIVVVLHLDHPNPEDLIVTLHAPGEQAVLLDQEPWVPGPIVAKGIPSDNTANGLWSLEIVDVVSGDAGTLHGWSLYVLSMWD